MLVFLLHRFAGVLEQLEFYSAGDSRVFITARIALASLSSFLFAILLGPFAIRLLKRRFRERIASDSERLNELHASKSATPTMGGIFILVATLLSALMWADLANDYVRLALGATFGLGILGGIDDWIKLRTAKKGLTVRQKFYAQWAICLLLGAGLYFQFRTTTYGASLIWPIGNYIIPLGWIYILWCGFVMTGSSNAVNLTDGLDGLASGCLVFAGSSVVGLCYIAGNKVMSEYLRIPYVPGSGELGVYLAAVVGAVLGFLWFNCHPAEVFMGDTGSLPLGGLIGLAGLVTRQEFVLVIICGVFVLETLSVIAQVSCFKLTRKRLIRCSPLHNHYLFRGDHEMKIVVRFWIVAALLAVAGISSLKIL